MPVSITVDFEKGLLKTCKHEFTESKVIGCYLYLYQALFRKLIKLLPQEPDIYISGAQTNRNTHVGSKRKNQ
ncbi:hypothetical protein HZS_312 [Henneguya salminicola]|nr:hypothetical protein HZS_312 [Henneguya salminicola]